jgi:hypothetical protein
MDSNLVMWGLIVGFFMPPLLAIVQQPGWSQPVRSIVMFAASLLAGAGTVYFTEGGFDTSNLTTTILVVMVTAISTYKGLWVPTGIAPKVEVNTSPKAQ